MAGKRKVHTATAALGCLEPAEGGWPTFPKARSYLESLMTQTNAVARFKVSCMIAAHRATLDWESRR